MTPLDWSAAATDIPSAGRRFQLEATEAERTAVATELGLISCERLTAQCIIRPQGKGRYRLEGPCIAEVTQACVVSLAPVTAHLTLPLDIDFAPDIDLGATVDDEVEVLALPEVAAIDNGRLGIGQVVFETLAAGLDPYPRATDAAFKWEDSRAVDSKANPFAVLHTLKTKIKPSDPETGGA